MTIQISNNTVAAASPPGTVIGTLSDTGFVPTSFSVIGFMFRQLFRVSGNQLLTAWSAPPKAGMYNLAVFALRQPFGFGIAGNLFLDFGLIQVIVVDTPPTKIVGDPASIIEVPLKPGV